ncbi:MAG: hypothetical protein QOH03_5419 [Kribbellaceae bacterium]|nr:hypothetical protein [Kribbellaceae bacterium]
MVEPLGATSSARSLTQESLANQIIGSIELARQSVRRTAGLEPAWSLTAESLLDATQQIVVGHFVRSVRDTDSTAYFFVTDLDLLADLRDAVDDLASPGGQETPNFLDRAARLSRNLEQLVEEVARMVPPSDQQWPSRVAAMRTASGRVNRRIAELQEARVAEVREEVDTVAAHVREAAGEVASTSLGSYFDTYASNQSRSANWLRLGVILLLLVVASVAGIVVFKDRAGGVWTEELARIAVTSPLILLAIYLSRESSRHRAAGDQARELEVRLKTVRAYTDELDGSDRNEIRALLGRRIFGADLATSTNKDEVVVEAIDPSSLKGAIEFFSGINRAAK